MVITKFRNRPPFNLKSKEDQAVIDRKSFIQNSRKTLENLEKSYIENFEILTDNKTRNIIPKVIDSFQKITPSKEVEKVSSLTESVHTLFRNKKSQFGRQIPNHQIMNSLLKHSHGNSMKRSYNHGIDTIPTKEIQKFKIEVKKRADKVCVDKKTSTTGLSSYNFNNNLPSNVKCVKSKIPQRKRFSNEHIRNNNTTLSSQPSSEVDIIPTKDKNSGCKIPTLVAKGKQKTFVLEARKSGHKCNTKPPRGFVGKQVEKYNKFGFGNASRTKSTVKNIPKDVDSGYIDIMSSIRENYPKLSSNNVDISSDHREWSDNTLSTLKDKVTFPRETRDAMEKLMGETRSTTRKPLAKFVKTKDMLLRPAISLDHNKRNLMCQNFK